MHLHGSHCRAALTEWAENACIYMVPTADAHLGDSMLQSIEINVTPQNPRILVGSLI